MTDALIEAVARAIVSYEGDPDGICDRTEKYRGQEINSQCKAWETRIDRARAALAAIDASGTHRVINHAEVDLAFSTGDPLEICRAVGRHKGETP